jgi:hypothetical protein
VRGIKSLFLRYPVACCGEVHSAGRVSWTFCWYACESLPLFFCNKGLLLEDVISSRKTDGVLQLLNTVKVDLNRKELIKAIRAMKKKERDSFLEDLLAATSPVYLESIREARADYKAGRIKAYKEVFGG